MTVRIRKGVFRIKFWLPTRTSAGVIMRAAGREINKRGFKTCYNKEQKRAIKKVILQAKKDFGKLQLLYVCTSEGFLIEIVL